jgi:hypothetical protein
MGCYNKDMTIMDKVKYCLGMYELNKLDSNLIELYGMPMQKAIFLFNKGLRRKDIQNMSILPNKKEK